MIELKIKLLDDGLPMPRYQHEGDAGLDLPSRVDLVIEPGERAMVPTGIAVAIPPGHAGFVLPRSGLASRQWPLSASPPAPAAAEPPRVLAAASPPPDCPRLWMCS